MNAFHHCKKNHIFRVKYEMISQKYNNTFIKTLNQSEIERNNIQLKILQISYKKFTISKNHQSFFFEEVQTFLVKHSVISSPHKITKKGSFNNWFK